MPTVQKPALMANKYRYLDTQVIVELPIDFLSEMYDTVMKKQEIVNVSLTEFRVAQLVTMW